MASSSLDLAGVLRSLPDDELVARLRLRQLRATTVRDAFDLADVLLEASSVRDALTHLDRTALRVLHAARVPGDVPALTARLADAPTAAGDDSPGAPDEAAVAAAVHELERRLLVVPMPDGTVATLDAAGDRLDDEKALTAEALASGRAPVVLETVTDHDREAVDARAAEQLAEIVVQGAELLRALEASPARELAKGGLSLPERRRLAEAARLDVDDVAALLRIVVRAGLAGLTPAGWAPTAAAADWLEAAWPDRWQALASAWLSSLPTEVLAVLHQRVETSWGEPLREFAHWAYPAGGAWIDDRLAAFAEAAHVLGLSADDVPTSAAVALLRDGPEAARERVALLLPEPIDSVYLQHDLTVVAPGPLRPDLEARLRTLAEAESTGLAATFRITEERVQRALSQGETAEGLLAFLEGVSSTGVPQPLAYLLQQSADSHGRFRVSAAPGDDPDGDVARVTARDVPSADALEVDQALAALALARRDPLALGTRAEAATVFRALQDERYPVVLVDADDAELPPPVRRGPVRQAPPERRDPELELVTRLRQGTGDADETTDRAWIARQLEAAVRGRLTVTVTVAMPDGSSRTLSLDPTGIGGGRVRGRDGKQDVERTLPLASITSVTGG